MELFNYFTDFHNNIFISDLNSQNITGSGLTSYQSKIQNFFLNSKQVVLLLYMKVGTGKTLTSLACAIKAIETGKYDNIIILSPKSVQHEFKSNLELYGSFVKYNSSINNKIKMIAYNGNNAQTKFKQLNLISKCIFIIDELHLFLRSVIKVNLLEDQHKGDIGNCSSILDMIRKIKDKRIIGLTGTPSAKFPFELVPFFNLDPDCNLPENIDEFNDRFIDESSKKILNQNILKSMLKNKVVYVDKEDTQHLKTTELIQEEVQMSELQYIQYLKDYQSELNERGFTNKRNKYGLPFGMKSTFHCKTFQDSVYVGEYKGDYNSVTDENHCPKIIKMYNDTKNIKGLCAFYFRFVDFGIKTMEKKLNKEGFKEFEPKNKIKGKHYILFTGNETHEYRNKCKEIYNSDENKYGDYIKYILISPSGSVGVTLKNVRYLGIGCVEFNYSMIAQIMGRVNRLNSHIALSVKDRTLTNKIYLSTKNEKYYKKHKQEIDKYCNRTTYQYDEKGLCIERIIFQDSIYDDIVNVNFRKLLEEISVI